MFDVKKMTDIEIDNKIQNINKKIYQTNNPDIIHQLYDYLDSLYEEQDERYLISLTAYEDGIALDTDKLYDDMISGGNKQKDGKKPKEKAKSFLDKMPKIEPKWNKQNPRNADDAEQ